MNEGTYKANWWFDKGDDGGAPMGGRSRIADWDQAQNDIIDEIEGRKWAAVDTLSLLCELTAKQRFVIERRYGVLDGYVYTLDEVGAAMGVSRQAVQQLEASAIRRLKALTRTNIERGGRGSRAGD